MSLIRWHMADRFVPESLMPLTASAQSVSQTTGPSTQVAAKSSPSRSDSFQFCLLRRAAPFELPGRREQYFSVCITSYYASTPTLAWPFSGTKEPSTFFFVVPTPGLTHLQILEFIDTALPVSKTPAAAPSFRHHVVTLVEILESVARVDSSRIFIFCEPCKSLACVILEEGKPW